MKRKAPAGDSSLHPEHNYIGVEFQYALWEVVSRCCIYPPDAAFGRKQRGWKDEDGKPVRRESVFLFWRMDEPESEYVNSAAERPRLHTILAALSQLCSRYAEKTDYIVLHALRRKKARTFKGSDWPSVNYQLWHSGFDFCDYAFQLEEHGDDDDFEAKLPPALPPLDEKFCQAAKKQWIALVAERMEYLLDTICDARSYEMLKPMLDEWFRYANQLDVRCLDWRVDIERLEFQPWYAEVLRRMPRLNPQGLCIIPLLSVGRFALLDYRPEEGRRFRFEARTIGSVPSGRILPAEDGEEALPYDAAKQLHLLPVPCENYLSNLWVPGIKTGVFYQEDWLGRDYCWDKPTE